MNIIQILDELELRTYLEWALRQYEASQEPDLLEV